MGTRVSCPHNGWYVLEGVEEIEALCDPDPVEVNTGATHDVMLVSSPRFVSLTIDPAYMGNRKERTIRVAIAQIIALEQVGTDA